MVPAMSSSRAPISMRQAEGGRQFRHALPDRLDAEHQMVVGARDDADEAVLAELGHRAAIGGEGEQADLDLARRAPCASSGDRPAVTISGSVKQTAGIAALVPAALVAGDDLGHHLALRHGAVRQHRLAGDVADGEDAAHRGAALVVDAG